MILKKLNLTNFRNYNNLAFYPSFRSLIIGDNGQGKTNLLESLTLLLCGKSFRTYQTESLIKDFTKPASICAEIQREGKADHLQLIINPSLNKKQFFINNKKSTAFTIADKWPLVLFSPESITLLKGCALARRDWMDQCLIQNGKFSVVKDFKKILQQKSRLLKQIKKDPASIKKFIEALLSINEIFALKSCNLALARQTWLKEIKNFLAPSAKKLFSSDKEVKIKYFIKGISKENYLLEDSGEGRPIETKEEYFKILKQKLEQSLDLELASGLCLYGPHRDDFKLYFDKKSVRYFCSQGQQRGLILSLKLAQIHWLIEEKNKKPLFLLDDVFSEIDKLILKNLIQFLEKTPVQMLLTSTGLPFRRDTRLFEVFYLKNAVLQQGNKYDEQQQL